MSEKPPIGLAQPPSPPDVAFYSKIVPTTQIENEDELDYPIPYNEGKAEQWAKEDPLFSKEDYEQDSYFDKDRQADLRRAIERVKSGEFIERVI